MTEVACDKCQGVTTPKEITSKKNGRKYTLYECTSGCVSDRGNFPHSCFAPKKGGSAFANPQKVTKTAVASITNDYIIDQLKQLHEKMDRILANMPK